MRCQEALEEMSAVLDGELESAGASSLQQHLGGCESCRTQQAQLRALDGVLRAPGLRALSVPEELRGRIASKLAHQMGGQKPPRRRVSPLAFAVAFTGAAAAAAALAIARPGPGADTTIATAGDTTAGDSSAAGGPYSLPARTRSPARGAGNDCRLARLGSSPVARACASGGTREARRLMRTLVEAARSRGMRFECRSCHRNEVDFDLVDGARERFASLVAAAGA